MPEKVDLAYAIGLPPEKAIEYFQKKGYRLTWDWWELWQEAHAKAFTVAKVMRMDILQDIRSMLEKALKEGITLQQFRKELEPRLKAKGWWGYKFVSYPDGRTEKILEGSPWRIKTIFRTNMQTAYMAGRYKAMMENIDSRPYWQYVAVLDRRTRPSHRALHGKVFRFDDPFWQTHYPPNGFNCRCRVRALSQKDVETKGYQVEKGYITWEYAVISKKTGEMRPVAVYHDPRTGMKIPTEPGWSYNPGRASWKPDLKQYHRTILEAAEKEERFFRSIETKQNEIRYLPHENCYAFDKSGNIKFTKSGSRSEIVFTEEEVKHIKEARVFIHNHPRSTSFSLEDICFACAWQIKEMRIVSSKYTYIMKPPKEGWDLTFFKEKIQPLFDKTSLEVRIEFLEKISKGELTPEEAELLHHHEIWTRISAILGLLYLRV